MDSIDLHTHFANHRGAVGTCPWGVRNPIFDAVELGFSNTRRIFHPGFGGESQTAGARIHDGGRYRVMGQPWPAPCGVFSQSIDQDQQLRFNNGADWHD